MWWDDIAQLKKEVASLDGKVKSLQQKHDKLIKASIERMAQVLDPNCFYLIHIPQDIPSYEAEQLKDLLEHDGIRCVIVSGLTRLNIVEMGT